ncbi:MAG: hypothetical protein MUC31_00565 [Bacteroidales bacterium]|nr:hypothetical protein [Bacteroidales bacterium]
MKTKIINIAFSFILLILNSLLIPGIQAQTKAKVEHVDFFAEGNRIVITYDLTGSQTAETFNVWIQVKTLSGKILNAKSLTGDIGKGIKGGTGKRIEWDYPADQLSTDEEITVEVFAVLETIAGKTETDADKPPVAAPGGRKISVGKALVLSAVLPGTGKTYIKGHGANWLLGIGGYALITGSVLLNHAAYDKLEEYRVSTDPDERDQLYNEAVANATVSYLFAGGAIAIWVVDFITTGVKAGKAKRSYENRVDVNWKYDPYARAPMIGLTYKF